MIFGLWIVVEWKVLLFIVKFLSYVIVDVCYWNVEIIIGLKVIIILCKLLGVLMVDCKNWFCGGFFWKRLLLV